VIGRPVASPAEGIPGIQFSAATLPITQRHRKHGSNGGISAVRSGRRVTWSQRAASPFNMLESAGLLTALPLMHELRALSWRISIHALEYSLTISPACGNPPWSIFHRFGGKSCRLCAGHPFEYRDLPGAQIYFFCALQAPGSECASAAGADDQCLEPGRPGGASCPPGGRRRAVAHQRVSIQRWRRRASRARMSGSRKVLVSSALPS
jgi:hypothetical protein